VPTASQTKYRCS